MQDRFTLTDGWMDRSAYYGIFIKCWKQNCLKRKSTPVYLIYECLLEAILIWNAAWPSPISPFADLQEIVKPPIEKLSHMVGFH